MDWLQFFNHLANLILPGAGTGMLAAAVVKLLWRRDLIAVPYLRLATWGMASAAMVAVAGLVIFGRDGLMQTYLLMVIACAIALAWAGWRRT